MKKILRLFERVFENRKKVGIFPNVTPGMEWVLEGEGVATEKIDRSCAIIDGVFINAMMPSGKRFCLQEQFLVVNRML